MAPSTSALHFRAAAPALADGLQREAQAKLALNDLFPHLRTASDAALRDIFVSQPHGPTGCGAAPGQHVK